MVEDALAHLVRGIVDNPDDLGRVIGRGGRTAGSFRTIADALAGRRTRVDFVDTTGSR